MIGALAPSPFVFCDPSQGVLGIRSPQAKEKRPCQEEGAGSHGQCFSDRGLFVEGVGLRCYPAGVSNVHPLQLTDRIFFVCVNLRPRIRRFHESEYGLLIEVLEASRGRLGFLLCGYVLMPDPWHALIWPQYPWLLWPVLHDAKKIMTLRLHARRGSHGPLWQHPYCDRFVRDAQEFNERLEYMHLNPVRQGLVKRPEDRRWSSYNNLAMERATVAACPLQIDCVRLPLGYRA